MFIISALFPGFLFFLYKWLASENNSKMYIFKNDPFVLLYHYTTKHGAESILKSGRVRASNGQGDAAFGIGVYMTSLSPYEHHMTKVALNNYDGVWRQNSDRTQAAIEFFIPESRVKRVNSARDVWLYTEGDLLLDRYATRKLFVGNAVGKYDWYLQQ